MKDDDDDVEAREGACSMETAILEDSRVEREGVVGGQARPFGVVVEECGCTRTRQVIGNKESGLRYVCNAAVGSHARLGVVVCVSLCPRSRGGTRGGNGSRSVSVSLCEWLSRCGRAGRAKFGLPGWPDQRDCEGCVFQPSNGCRAALVVIAGWGRNRSAL